MGNAHALTRGQNVWTIPTPYMLQQHHTMHAPPTHTPAMEAPPACVATPPSSAHLAGLVPHVVCGQGPCEDEPAQLLLHQPCLPRTHRCQHAVSLENLIPLDVGPRPRRRRPQGQLRLLLLLLRLGWGRPGLGPGKPCTEAAAATHRAAHRFEACNTGHTSFRSEGSCKTVNQSA